MNRLNPDESYLTLQLKWGRENYIHQIGFNVQNTGYLTTELFQEDQKLPEPFFLYKFFRANDNSLSSLKDHYLYFSDPKGFGDEYDCLVSDNEYIQKIIDHSIYNQKSIGVCCFCTVPDEDQMWDFYADGFKGFALKYKNDKSFLPYGKHAGIKSHVLYLNDNSRNHPNLLETLKSLEGKHFSQVVNGWQNQVLYQHELCRKRTKYNFEKEYRAISFNATEFDRQIPIRKNSIDSIYIGNKMTKDFLNDLIPILRDNQTIKIFLVTHDYQNENIQFKRAKNISKLKELLGI